MKSMYNAQHNMIAQQLKKLRIEKNLSQKELSLILQDLGVNISQQRISKIEHNKCIVKDYEFFCICIALNESPDKLLNYFTFK